MCFVCACCFLNLVCFCFGWALCLFVVCFFLVLFVLTAVIFALSFHVCGVAVCFVVC